MGRIRALVLLLLAALVCMAPACAEGKPGHHRRTHHRRVKHTARHKASRHRRATSKRRRRPVVRRPVAAPDAAWPAPAAAAPAAAWPPAAPSSQLFAASSFWNAPLPGDAPLDALSSTYVAELRAQVARQAPWINTTRYSAPVYTVPADQPTVRVTLDNNQPALQAAFESVPLPPDARPAAGSDQELVVWQPSTDTMWEFWGLGPRLDGWHARYGGEMDHVSSNPGYYVDHPRWGATATSLPVLGGLMRLDELRAGHIDHALAIALPDVRSTVYSWPAQRTDGTVDDPNAIPEGTRFRLDPTLDLSTIPMSPMTRLMAEAVQRYGMVVRDRSGTVTFFGEDPTPTGSDPYGVFFGGQYPSTLLAQFPWAHLQALRTDLHVDPM